MVLSFQTLFLNQGIRSFLVKELIIESSIRFCWGFSKLKDDVINTHDGFISHFLKKMQDTNKPVSSAV